MIAWVLLGGSIVTEVAATLSLRMASRGKNRWWWVAVAVGYVFAFALLSGTLSTGMSLGVAYGTWVAVGVALTAVLSHFLFKEPFTWLMGLGIALIIGGVLMIELGAAH